MSDPTASGRGVRSRAGVRGRGRTAPTPAQDRPKRRRRRSPRARIPGAAEMPGRQRSSRSLGDEEVLDRLRALARGKGGRLTERDLVGTGVPSRGALVRRFGSWRAALERAGLGRPRGSFRYTDEECFANLAMLWRQRGGPPRLADTDRAPSTVGSAAYLRRAGTWQRALSAFAAFTGADPSGPGPAGAVARIATVAPLDDTAPRAARPAGNARGRGLSLRLRFKVLQRDRFRCTACGNGPAADPDCRLQVDHIVPRSKGGGDDLANLRSLCADCNLGRGNRGAED